MAGAHQFVCPFFGVVFERLNSLIHNVQINECSPLVKELTKLFKSFLKIKEVIDDAEEKQFNKKADAVRFWLQELNDAAYKADDVFDDVEYEVLQQAKGSSSSSNKKRKRQRKQRKIQKLIQIFDELAEECSGLELQKGKEKSVLVSPDRITDPFLTDESKVYGRDKDREELVKQLLGPAYLTLQESPSPIRYEHPRTNRKPVLDSANSSSSSSSKDNFSVFPIQGMGGLGKTTLAKMVYNDELVKKHFNFRSWVCISTDFDTRRIMKEIVASLPKPTSATEKSELQKHFHKELRDKRFLVVLDDVWDVTQDEWNEMKAFFSFGKQGNSVIVTTRLRTAACITDAHSNCISGLSDKNCWKLFKQYAFGLGNEERPALVKIGKEIVKKCQGLPLAAKALGGLLRFKNDENEWISIKDSAIWNFENDILPVLRLSYLHLPTTLKQCFVYCSLFPKDYKIRKGELIQLWMANGLLEQSRANIELEDAGNGIFNALLWRSFFQDIEKDENGNIIICKMHDLVHDLASYIAGDEYFAEDSGSVKNITRRTCYVSLRPISKVPRSSIPESVQGSSPRLRSLIQLNNEEAVQGSSPRLPLKPKFIFSKFILIHLNNEEATLKPEFIFSNFILLRALDLNYCGIEVVPDCIGEMKHLRYLNLSCNLFTLLPESICLLRNIQTLKLSYCSELESLPKNIGNMSSLRHLDYEGCWKLSCMPIGIGLLTRLISLSKFIVGEKGESGVDGLHGLNYLRGELKIYGLEYVETTTEAAQANLTSKKNVHSLELNWAWAWYSKPLQRHDQNVIEGLQPHSNLRKLAVRGYKGLTLSPSWLAEEASSLLPNLVQISLFHCTCEHLGSLRKLRRLKILELYEMDSLKFIEEGEVVGDASAAGGFPSLEELKLVGMHNLEGWSSSSSSSSQAAAATAVFPCLKKVVLRDCPKVERVPLAWSPVEDVEIDNRKCNGMVLGSLRDLPSLPSLRIYGFKKLEYFPSGTLTNLTALHKLEIHKCGRLRALPVELYSLATLTVLSITDCPKLVSLAPEEREGGLKNLSSLKTLQIVSCHALKSLLELGKASLVSLIINNCPEMEFSKEDFEHLVVLEKLQLYGLPKLTCFPEGLKHSAKTLRDLEFLPSNRHRAEPPVDLPDWIGTTLTSLEHLRIDAPKNWNVLPQWMQYLNALKRLEIQRCDQELVKRWENRDRQREVYNSFNMISHVPHVELW